MPARQLTISWELPPLRQHRHVARIRCRCQRGGDPSARLQPRGGMARLFRLLRQPRDRTDLGRPVRIADADRLRDALGLGVVAPGGSGALVRLCPLLEKAGAGIDRGERDLCAVAAVRQDLNVRPASAGVVDFRPPPEVQLHSISDQRGQMHLHTFHGYAPAWVAHQLHAGPVDLLRAHRYGQLRGEDTVAAAIGNKRRSLIRIASVPVDGVAARAFHSRAPQ